MYAKIGVFSFYGWALSSLVKGKIPALKTYLKEVGAAKFNVTRPFFSLGWAKIPQGSCVTLNL
jgi:hypothetical protein